MKRFNALLTDKNILGRYLLSYKTKSLQSCFFQSIAKTLKLVNLFKTDSKHLEMPLIYAKKFFLQKAERLFMTQNTV